MKICNPEQRYQKLNTVIWDCKYHVIFTPKYRRPVLKDGIDTRFEELVLEKQDEFGYQVIEMEVMEDHVHLLLYISPDKPIRSTISMLKGYTARVLREEFPSLKTRLPSLWTRSMFVTSVGSVSLETVKQYIINQKINSMDS